MDIGKIKDNYIFYEGYEGEPEIIISLSNKIAIHIWDGYFEDILNSPPLNGKGWSGFTRDYHQLEGIFSENISEQFIEPQEYLNDLYIYKNKQFEYEETKQLFNILVELFKEALLKKLRVKIELR